MDQSADGSAGSKDVRTVTVTFNADHTFEFSCDSTTMRRAGKIVLERDSDVVLWTFLGVSLPKPPFTWEVAAGGTSITITNHQTKKGEFHYTVTIVENGTPYTSPDDGRTNPPMIRNL